MRAFPVTYSVEARRRWNLMLTQSGNRCIITWEALSLTFSHPGTRPCSIFILSLIFSLLAWNQAMVEASHHGGLKKASDSMCVQVSSSKYPFCKTVAIRGLTSSCSDMNVSTSGIQTSFWPFGIIGFRFLLLCFLLPASQSPLFLDFPLLGILATERRRT